jgi:hypothetical protein
MLDGAGAEALKGFFGGVPGGENAEDGDAPGDGGKVRKRRRRRKRMIVGLASPRSVTMGIDGVGLTGLSLPA